MAKVTNTVEVTRNSFKDDGDGVVTFPNGLTISDDHTQRNGTRYDIDSLDISKYGGQLTADHEDKLRNIIGRVEGVHKDHGRLYVNKIIYAVNQNPYARLAYDLLVNGFSKSFSTETIGPLPSATDNTNYNHELVGLSQVVTPNNYSANVNQITQVVHNSLEASKADGLDVDGIEHKFMNQLKEEDMSKTDIENTADKVVKNAEVEEVFLEENAAKKSKKKDDEANVQPKPEQGKSTSKKQTPEDDMDKTDGQKEDDEKPDDKPEDDDSKSPAKSKDTDDEQSDDEESDDEQSDDEESDEEQSDDTEDDEDSKKKKKAKNEYEFADDGYDRIDNDIDDVAADVSDEQIQEAQDMVDALTELVDAVVTKRLKGQKEDTRDTKDIVVEDIDNSVEEEDKKENQMNKEEVQQAVVDAIKNMLGDEAQEPTFQKNEATKTENGLENADWKERYNKQVNSAWEALRAGSTVAQRKLSEINQFNLNALKEAGIAKNAMTLESMGNFVLPPEMYQEIQGIRTDYTPLIKATEWKETDRLEFAWLRRKGDIDMKNVAMCDDGNDGNLKPISEYEAEPVTSKLEELAAVTVVCNATTRFFAADLLGDVAAGYRNDYDRKRAQLVIARFEQAVENNPAQEVTMNYDSDVKALIAWLEATASISDTTVNGTFIFNNKTFAKLKAYALQAGVAGPLSHIFTDGDVPQIFGNPYIVVPNDLMPTIDSQDAIQFMVDGKPVNITHSVFYADLSTFTGRTSGGLQYDVATQASYEVNGQIRSAYQRNEMVLRGSFFRGGAVKDESRVAGITEFVAGS